MRSERGRKGFRCGFNFVFLGARIESRVRRWIGVGWEYDWEARAERSQDGRVAE